MAWLAPDSKRQEKNISGHRQQMAPQCNIQLNSAFQCDIQSPRWTDESNGWLHFIQIVEPQIVQQKQPNSKTANFNLKLIGAESTRLDPITRGIQIFLRMDIDKSNEIEPC